jgi:hypothetical protein
MSLNPMSSAQSTPDPSRGAPFFSNIAGSAASPHAVNGNAPPFLPSIHSLSSIQAQHPQESRTYFDPAYDEQRAQGTDNGAEYPGRRRAHSGAVLPLSDPREVPNGDTDMADASGAGFTAVNNP